MCGIQPQLLFLSHFLRGGYATSLIVCLLVLKWKYCLEWTVTYSINIRLECSCCNASCRVSSLRHIRVHLNRVPQPFSSSRIHLLDSIYLLRFKSCVVRFWLFFEIGVIDRWTRALLQARRGQYALQNFDLAQFSWCGGFAFPNSRTDSRREHSPTTSSAKRTIHDNSWKNVSLWFKFLKRKFDR